MSEQRVSSELQIKHRHLPHWQIGGSIYFVTFRSHRGILPDEAKRLTIKHILHDHGKKHFLHFGVVMPDHVHLLIEPLRRSEETWHDLSAIMKSIKGVSSRRINQFLGTLGNLWQDESYDRIMRDEAEYLEKLNYIWNNPVKVGLVSNPEDYEFYVYPEWGRAQVSCPSEGYCLGQTRVSGPPTSHSKQQGSANA